MAGRGSERSIIQVGDSALAVTLPSWWVRVHGLKARMKVGVEVMADGSLRIIPRSLGEREALSRVVSVSEKMAEGSIVREVVASYLAGFTRIRIVYPPAAYSKVRRLKRILEEVMLGLTLVEEGVGYMEYYVTVDPGSIGFWEAIGKAYRATLSMLKDAINAAERGDLDALKGIPERDTLVDRLYLYASRKANMVLLGLEPFSTLGLSSLAEVPSLVMAAKSIERVADHTVLISGNLHSILASGGVVPESVMNMVKEACHAFEVSGRALLGRSRSAAEEVAEIIDKYPARRIPPQAGRTPQETLIIDSARRILGYSLDIAETVIDLESVRHASEASTAGLRQAGGRQG